MSDAAAFTDDGPAGTLRFSGSLSLARLGDLPDRLAVYDGNVERIDLSGIERLDTIGAWTIHRFAQKNGAAVEGLTPDGQHLFDQVQAADQPVRIRGEHIPAFYRVLGEVGEATIQAGRTLYGLLGFLGGITIAVGSIIRYRRFRFNATVQQFEVVGVSALAIIGLMSFLIGIVIAQQGAVQLRQFGAEIYTINLVGRLSMRELGVSPMEALVVPRVLASTVMMVFLGFYSALVAIIGGGLLCWASLGIPLVTYVQQIREVVPISDVYVGLIKAPVFGAIIGMAGCFQGMQVEANAEQVGLRTTAAVVQGIFLVIVLDAFFAVFFSSVGWL